MIALNMYLQSNQQKIFDKLSFINNGGVSFDKASISIFSNFPAATIFFKNVELSEEDHQNPIVFFENLNVGISLKKLLDSELEIKTIEVVNGAININTDSNCNNNLFSLFKQKIDGEIDEKNFPFKIKKDRLKIHLYNVKFNSHHVIRDTGIKGNINMLACDLNLLEKKQSADVDFNFSIDEFIFNVKKDVFLKNSRLSGKTKLDLIGSLLKVEPFDLKANDEHIMFSAEYYTDESALSTIVFENEHSRFRKTMALLHERLTKKLLKVDIPKPFYTKTTLKGTFEYGENPLIEIQFDLDGNDINAKIKDENFDFENVVGVGRIFNRIYDDERALFESEKNLRFELDTFSANYTDFNIQTKDALMTFTIEDGFVVNANTKVQGKAKGISDWLENDQFYFKEGEFELLADINGSFSNMHDLLTASDAELKLEDFSVFYEPARVSFPFKKLELNKKVGDANFSLISSTWKENRNYKIKGGLEKLPELLFNLNGGQAKSVVEIQANKLGWTDFLDFFGENGYLKKDKSKSEREKKKSMKEVVKGIYHNFQPRLLIKVDTLIYDDNLEFHNFSTGLHFENDHLLILENTVFNYDNGSVSLDAIIDINDPTKTPFEFELQTEKLNLKELLPKVNYFTVELLENLNDLPDDAELSVKHKGILDDTKGLIPNTSTGEIDFELNKGETLKGKIKYKPGPDFINADNSFVNATIKLEGDPIVFNNFFKTDQFFFSKGRFYADMDFAGEITSVNQLLTASNAVVEINDSEVYYKAVDISFPLTKIDLKLSKDNADFNFYLNSDLYKQEILFSGGIQNISELVIGNTGKQLKTNVLAKSPKLNWDSFLYLFGSDTDTENYTYTYTSGKDKLGSYVDGMKKTISGILNTFNPSLQVRVGTFVYSDKLMIKNFETGIHLPESGKLVLEKTAFNFLNGKVGMDGTIDIGKEEIVAFDVNFQTDELDLAALLKSLDYLSIPSLQNIEKLSGEITLNFDFEGILQEDGRGLLTEHTRGLLDFDLRNVELKGFAPLDSIAMKIKREERFGNLKFAPISNQIQITGNELEFPLMEVQSNAINFFAEGIFSFGNKTNIWISIPINNVKSRDLEIIPEKNGYANTNNKVFVEVDANEEGVNKFKFHISKRKFYKDREMLDQFKEDKQSFRAERANGRKKWWRKND